MVTVVRPPIRWIFSNFYPLSFVAFLDYHHDLPARKWIKCLHLFAERSRESFEDHLATFSKFLDDFKVEHEDVAMRIFVLTLKGEAQTWYESLPNASVDGWDSIQANFIE
jgi:hypothetical protein